MVRGTMVAVTALMIAASGLSADEIKGKVKSVDTEKGTITVTVDDKDQTYTVAKDAKVTKLVGKNLKKATTEDVTDGLSGVKADSNVALTVEKKDDAETVTAIKIDALTKKKKKKDKSAS